MTIRQPKSKGRRPKSRGGSFPGERPCAAPDCAEPGEYRAPTTRPGTTPPTDRQPEWQYLCLDHVRAFNQGWNWFQGMTDSEILEAQSPFPQWERKTREFAHNPSVENIDRMADILGNFRRGTERPGKSRFSMSLPGEVRQALARFGLDGESTLSDVKSAYRRLARRYHPDLNAGKRDKEASFHVLTEAYDTLCQSPEFRMLSERNMARARRSA